MTVDEALARADERLAEPDFVDDSDTLDVLAVEVRRLRDLTMVNALKRSVKLCESAREKERASVVRYLRAKARRQVDGTTRSILIFAARDIEAGEHVRDELGGDDDRG